MTVFQGVLAVGFVAACAYTVVGYPSRYGALSGRSRLFRTVGLFLFDLLLGLVLLGTFLPFGGPNKAAEAVRLVAYLMACLFLALSLICIAVLDWLESFVVYRRAQRDLAQQILQSDASSAGDEANPKPSSKIE